VGRYHAVHWKSSYTGERTRDQVNGMFNDAIKIEKFMLYPTRTVNTNRGQLRIRKEANVRYFKWLLLYLLGSTKENHEIHG